MESPPPFAGEASFGPCGFNNLAAFAKPTTVQYSTQALSISQITVVKQIEHAELCSSAYVIDENSCKTTEQKKELEDERKDELQNVDASFVAGGSVAGSGIVTVKRIVHGYKKLSHVNRKELSRTNIVLPPMEYDTYALWIDADASFVRDVILDFDAGVHALSHAMVAVAPLFVPCASSDLDCDHSRYGCTRILLFDVRAGGSGLTSQLFRCLMECLESAVELLEQCTSCYSEKGYDGGCPGCLQSVPCDNFHQDLSRVAGVHVGKHLLQRLKKSDLRHQCNNPYEAKSHNSAQTHMPSEKGGNSRRISRQGKGVDSSRGVNDIMQNVVKPKKIIIGRASWMENKDQARWAEVDD